ncbi:MAG: hypothetical protein JO040_13555 [Gemmatimonadetes bacterium]|nr:hypothetical protein [Gemmatimonadota bacterium]
MLLATLAAALLFQGTPAAAAPDTGAFDSPATRALVERVMAAGATVPPALADYRATFRSAAYISARSDSATGGEVPLTVDEFAGDVRWERGGSLVQTVRGQRVRMLAPTPYTLGSMLESPWIVPHLYGHTIEIFQISPSATAASRRVTQAVHPFSPQGVDLYAYRAADTVRVSTPDGVVTLVSIDVRPRVTFLRPNAPRLVVGSFQVDLDRAAVARARFGFAEEGGRGLRLTRTGVFFELENGLVQGRYWLPYRQRQELQLTSPLFGGAVAIRVATSLSGFEVNTGWRPAGGERFALVRQMARGDSAFRDWREPIGEGVGEFDIADFADLLRETGGGARADRGGLGISFLPERSSHLFRYNRVEGPFLGAAVSVESGDPGARAQLYGTAGWAFSEGTARGEAVGRWITERTGPGGARGWTYQAGVYRRLREMQAFRPSFRWELGNTLNAALGGYDILDYYDAAGLELSAGFRSGPWTATFGGRTERQEPVERNTESFLFGRARRFPEVARADSGTHTGIEGELRYARGAGAFSIGNSVIASLRGEAGVGDWKFGRVIGLLSSRESLGRYVTLATRVDAGTALGDPPAQFLLRFGEAEGLRSYDPNQFGGTSAAIGRGRLLLFLPPYTQEPLARFGFFLVPPLRPALVLSGSGAWARVADRSRDELFRVGSVPTDGVRGTVGIGISIFEDAFTVEWNCPLEKGEKGKVYVGLVQWF